MFPLKIVHGEPFDVIYNAGLGFFMLKNIYFLSFCSLNALWLEASDAMMTKDKRRVWARAREIKTEQSNEQQ